ncbi:MAG: AI-2E family transporter, partial [Actinomycetota bacterium]|nr:AI-2E family transporter [Actinomycetota bacterium]
MRASAIAKVILVAAAVAAGLYFLYLIRTVIGALVIAVFLAVALGPAVDFFQRRRIPRGFAILVTYIALFAAIFGIGLLIVPPIVSQVNVFVENFPRYVTDVRKSPTLREYDDRYEITEKLRTQAENLPDRLGGAVEALRSVTVGVFSALLAVVTILVMAFFLLLDGRRIVRWVERELGPERGPHVRQIADDVYSAVGGYVSGMAVIATMAGVGTYLVLTLLGVPFAVPLAVLMAFLDLIPLIGATIAGAIIALVAAATNFPTALVVWLAYFILYQQIENNVTQPLVFRRTVQLAPLVVIVSVLIGASLLGVLGALLAIPIAAAIQIVVKDLWAGRKRRVGAPTEDRAPPPPFAPAPA